MKRWASLAMGTSGTEFLAAIRSEIRVGLIATPRANLNCHRKDRWQEVEDDPDLADFDQVPLINRRGAEIEAVFIRGTGLVELREDMFMASDAPLISFLESADRQRFRLLLSDRSVSGMVTLSDVQKLPVYSVLFSLLNAVEMVLMDSIRNTCGANKDHWLQYLSKTQQRAIEHNWDKAAKENLAIDRLSCATFGQEIQAAAGLGLFEDALEYRESLLALAKLRNTVYHAAEFALTPEQALKLPKHVRDAQSVTSWLRKQIKGVRT
jgi:hypothetical protein